MGRPRKPEVRIGEEVYERTGKRRSWRVRWVVGTKASEKTFAQWGEANAFRARLVVAVEDREMFSRITGLPESWAETDETVADFAKRWYLIKKNVWKPNNRRSAVESLARLLVVLVRGGTAKLTNSERNALAREVTAWLVDGTGTKQVPGHLKKSMKLVDLTADVGIDGDVAVSSRWEDGAPTGSVLSSRTQTRHRRVIRQMFDSAVSRGLLDAQPWPAAASSLVAGRKARSGPLDRSMLPSVAQAKVLIEAVRSRHPRSRAYQTALYSMLYAGLRPAEAFALRIENLTFPAEGEVVGSIRVNAAVTGAGELFTEEDEQVGDPKTKARVVPMFPPLVVLLRDWVGDRTEGYVFADDRGGLPLRDSVDHRWQHAKKVNFPGRQWGLYSLRHLCATLWVDAGVPLGVVAKWLGHSVETLLKHYVRTVDGSEEIGLARASGVFDGEGVPQAAVKTPPKPRSKRGGVAPSLAQTGVKGGSCNPPSTYGRKNNAGNPRR